MKRMSDTSSPQPATGVRLSFADLPAGVRKEIETRAGAGVVEAADQAGGFSPGVAARLVLADGSRIFVKAVGKAQNPDSPGMYRAEAQALGALPASAPAPRLLWTYDDGDWVALGVEDIEGRQPGVPWRRAELDRVLDGLDEMAAALTPAPSGFPDVRKSLAGTLSGWRTLAADPPPDLDDWTRRNLGRLAELEARWPEEAGGDTLLHIDLRADNVLFDGEGRMWVIDWAHAATGAAWVDLVLFLVSVTRDSDADPDELLLSCETGRTAPRAGVDALVCAFAGFMTEACRRPAPPGLPTLRAFQRSYAEPNLEWARRRTGWR
jgi:aminoglycoside phosphotransferase (APT) family kinase protein